VNIIKSLRLFIINKIKWSKNRYGFTLLEIIVAIAIFAVIVSLIYPAYTGTYRNIEIAETQADIYEMARTTLIRIIEDLESVYIPEVSQASQPNDITEFFKGQNDFIDARRADRIRFYSKSHIDISETPFEAGEAKISYYPLLKEDESISLYRSDTPGNLKWPEENTEGWLICEGLYSISFKYVDKNGDTYDAWDETHMNSSKKLPSIININLEFIDKDDPEKPITFSTAVYIPLAN